jgi:transposase InsO family protein
LQLDRDGACGDEFRRRVENLGIEEVISAPQSPWQNPYAERVIGTIRRELLNYVIVLNEAHLKRLIDIPRARRKFRAWIGVRSTVFSTTTCDQLRDSSICSSGPYPAFQISYRERQR